MINILICADKKYLDIATTTLYSVRCHTDEPIHCYVCQKGIAKNYLDAFKKQIEKYNIEYSIIDFQLSLNETVKECYSIETYYRLFAQFFLPVELDRVLYIDADIVALNDISAFYHQDFEGKAFVACPDIDDDGHKKRLGLSDDSHYVNAGVLLINLKLLRDNTTEAGILQAISDLRGKLLLHDQDLLNIKFGDLIKYAPSNKYNSIKSKKEIKKDDGVVLLHYAGSEKPWLPNGIWKTNAHFYWHYRIKQKPSALFKHIAVLLLVVPYAGKNVLRLLFHLIFPDMHPLRQLKK